MLTRPAFIRTVAFGAALTFLLAAAHAQTLGPAAQAQLQKACMGDVQRLCPGVQPGGGRLLDCLKKQPDQVSSTCKGALSSIMGHR